MVNLIRLWYSLIYSNFVDVWFLGNKYVAYLDCKRGLYDIGGMLPGADLKASNPVASVLDFIKYMPNSIVQELLCGNNLRRREYAQEMVCRFN